MQGKTKCKCGEPRLACKDCTVKRLEIALDALRYVEGSTRGDANYGSIRSYELDRGGLNIMASVAIEKIMRDK